MKKRVLAGMRPTGKMHLGNYLGGAKGMLALQDDPEYDTSYFVVDMHAITTPYDKDTLKQDTRSIIIDYLACGLDPSKSTIFVQSDIADITAELMFYFSSVVTVARMRHLPTFKEKIKQHPDHVTMALLNYPVLMAADILIHKAEKVPVGIDQEPHLEISREIARKMNQEYGMDFPEPNRFATAGEYVPSLTGEGKMSKSVKGSYINITDDLETINQKLATAPTDSGKGESLPSAGGVANLLTYVELFQGTKSRQEYETLYTTDGIRYQDLKENLAQAIYNEIKPIQDKRKELESNPDYVDQVIREGAEKARTVAQNTVEEVKEKMGLA